jgi:hypothetical protein
MPRSMACAYGASPSSLRIFYSLFENTASRCFLTHALKRVITDNP